MSVQLLNELPRPSTLNSQLSTKVEIRPSPYPYRSILALCSDLDSTPDRHAYVELLRFLNTTDKTVAGTGVGLEVGNSIYFDVPSYEFSYWNTDDEGREVVRALIQSGHIDCLHSFGHLAVERAQAAKALDELERHRCHLRVWVDHGKAPTNFGADIMRGHGDEVGHPAYHADLTIAHGIRYVWLGRVTSMIGQNGQPSLRGIANPRHPLASAATLAKEAAKCALACCGNRKYRLHAKNRVMHRTHLRDGRRAYEFLRANPHWAGVSAGDTACGSADVLSRRMLERLVERQGACILYTHLGKCRPVSQGLLDARAVAAFRQLAAYQEQGRILVTTTRRLLEYERARLELRVTACRMENHVTVELTADESPWAGSPLSAAECQGLTFYLTEAHTAQILLNGRPLPTVLNPCDETGRCSCSVPWSRLSFPSISRSGQ